MKRKSGDLGKNVHPLTFGRKGHDTNPILYFSFGHIRHSLADFGGNHCLKFYLYSVTLDILSPILAGTIV